MTALRRCLTVLCAMVALSLAAPPTSSGPPKPRNVADHPRAPAGWETLSPREEVSPTFSYDPKGGPNGGGAFVLTAGDSVGQHGWWQNVFPVTGGKFYR